MLYQAASGEFFVQGKFIFDFCFHLVCSANPVKHFWSAFAQ